MSFRSHRRLHRRALARVAEDAPHLSRAIIDCLQFASAEGAFLAPSRSPDPPRHPVLTALTAAQSGSPAGCFAIRRFRRTAIAFVYAGDIWIVDIGGGTARQLTSHEGQELFPRFSPDGQSIAFTGQYRRPAAGLRHAGLRRHPAAADLLQRRLLDAACAAASTTRCSAGRRTAATSCSTPTARRGAIATPVPYLVPAAGGTEQPLPMREGAGGWLSPDGTRYAYTPVMREFRTWKRYKGGRAQDVWIYDLKANTAEQITNYEGTDNQPVWLGDTIYFTSDRGAQPAAEPLGVRRPTRPDPPGDHPRSLRRALAERRPRRRGLRERRPHLPLRSRRRAAASEVPIRIAGDLRRTVPVREGRQERDPIDEPLADGAPRPRRSARRRLHRAGARGRDPQPHRDTRHPGNRPELVARRPVGRVPVGSHRRVRDLRQAVRWLRARSAASPTMATPGASRRSGRPTPRRLLFGDKRQRLRITDVATGKTDRRRQGLVHRSHVVYLVARQPLGGVRQGGAGHAADGDLGVLARRRTAAPVDVGQRGRPRAGLRPEGPLPLLPVEPRLQPDVQRLRVQLSLRRLDARLRRPAREGRPGPPPAAQRRRAAARIGGAASALARRARSPRSRRQSRSRSAARPNRRRTMPARRSARAACSGAGGRARMRRRQRPSA